MSLKRSTKPTKYVFGNVLGKKTCLTAGLISKKLTKPFVKIEFNEDFVAKIWLYSIILVKAHDLFNKTGSQSSMEVTILIHFVFFL